MGWGGGAAVFGVPPDPKHPPAAHTGKRRHLTCDLAAQHDRCNTQRKHAALNLAYHLISGIWARGIASLGTPPPVYRPGWILVRKTRTLTTNYHALTKSASCTAKLERKWQLG